MEAVNNQKHRCTPEQHAAPAPGATESDMRVLLGILIEDAIEAVSHRNSTGSSDAKA